MRGKGSGIINFLANIATAHEIKNDPLRKDKCMRFGIQAIAYSIVAVGCAALAAVFPIMMQGIGALLVIFGIAIFLIGLGGAALFTLNAVVNWILQISVNRRAITWVSLIFLLAGIAGTAIVLLWVFSLF